MFLVKLEDLPNPENLDQQPKLLCSSSLNGYLKYFPFLIIPLHLNGARYLLCGNVLNIIKKNSLNF